MNWEIKTLGKIRKEDKFIDNWFRFYENEEYKKDGEKLI